MICSIISALTFVAFVYNLYEVGDLYSKVQNSFTRDVMTIYWLSKILELLDTIFMILRHKSRQITFLHVYHHSSILLLADYACHEYPWPAIAVYLMLNSFVHVVLYLYYALAAFGVESVSKWRPRLTELQILQFFIDMIFSGWGYLHHGFCIYGPIYGFLMIVLFVNFYIRAYIVRKSGVSSNEKSKKN